MTSKSLIALDDLHRCQDIYYGAPLSEPITGEAHDFLLTLIARHPDASRKIGCGIDHFEVRANTRFPGRRAMWLVRRDGSATDWSYTKCLHAPASTKSVVLAALRFEVVDQVEAFKKAGIQAGARCAVTGVALDGGCHVDHHRPSFEELADRFVVTATDGYPLIAVATATDGVIGRRLEDREMARAWAAYHEIHARLRLTTAHANLTKRRKP